MLHLNRKDGERIILEMEDGRLITIEVCLDCRQKRVQLRIHAPDDVWIYREEMWLEEQERRTHE